jgi:phosphoribosylformylglycinamidine synthase
MCVGLVNASRLVRARASGVGNLLMLVGGDTGRDGVHGATFASVELAEGEKPSPVAIGNPELEKRLIAACLELFETDYLVGMQDLGAAGLTCSTVECAARAGAGVAFDVLKVPRREEGMTPEEVLLSESQERMLVIVKRGYEDGVKALFDKWELRSDIIGRVTSDGIARIKEGDSVVAEVPVALLTDPPLYRLRVRKPGWLSRLQRFDLEVAPDVARVDANDILLRLLSSPNIASKEWVYRQYDHQVQTNTVIPPGSDAAVLRIKGTEKGIALVADGNGRHCYLDPYAGGAMAVAEAARNVVCTGAEPIALTDCLNLGNPEKPEIYYQLKECIRGMARACRVLGTPVVSGNVSLYNETRGEAVYPTPVVGMLGLIENIKKRCTPEFKREGDRVFLLGDQGAGISALAGSEYLEAIHGIVAGRPEIDLELEKRVQQCCLGAIREGIVNSAHDCSEGGLAVALAECSILGAVGFNGALLKDENRIDAALFGESPSRIVVSVKPSDAEKLEKIARRYSVPLKTLGVVGGERFIIEGFIDLPLNQVERAWRKGLEEALG